VERVVAKRQLKLAIQQIKKRCWKELISTVDGDPFGKPYKLVMRKLRGPPAIASMEMQTMQTVICPPPNPQFHPSRTRLMRQLKEHAARTRHPALTVVTAKSSRQSTKPIKAT